MSVLEAIGGLFLEVIAQIALSLLLLLVGLPLICLLCKPVILMVAFFGPGSYTGKVLAGYKGVCQGAAAL